MSGTNSSSDKRAGKPDDFADFKRLSHPFDMQNLLPSKT